MCTIYRTLYESPIDGVQLMFSNACFGAQPGARNKIQTNTHTHTGNTRINQHFRRVTETTFAVLSFPVYNLYWRPYSSAHWLSFVFLRPCTGSSQIVSFSFPSAWGIRSRLPNVWFLSLFPDTCMFESIRMLHTSWPLQHSCKHTQRTCWHAE